MSWRVLVIVLLLPSVVFAQTPPVQTIPPGEDKIITLREGEKAPFSGHLYDPATALRWANWLEQYKLRLREDVRVQMTICEIEKKYRDDRLELAETTYDQRVDDLQQRLLKSEKARLQSEEREREPGPFWKTPVFGFAVGVSVTSLVVGLGTWVSGN